MRWCAPGYEESLEALIAALADTPWPGPPSGYAHVATPRPMRTVLRGTWESARGSQAVIVKWSREDTLSDAVSKSLRGGKGVREGRVLEALAAADVRAPVAIAADDEQTDVLVTLEEPALEPLPAADAATREELREVAALLATAHGAGLRHRDLHAGNLAWTPEGPMIVDLGGARIGDAFDDRTRVRELGGSVHSLLGTTRRTQRLRALIAYEAARGKDHPRASALGCARPIEAAAAEVRRAYRRGRDRRARRTGRHFEQFATDAVVRGARFKDTTDASWLARADAWLEAPPEGATELKDGGSVLREGDVVLKYYDAVAPKRLPRPLRAFRRAFALMNRGVAVPLPHLAATKADGSGVYAAAYVDAPNLHQVVAAQTADGALLRRIGRALRRMHDAEVTHRDLKAPNILAASDGTFPIVDLEGLRLRKRPVPWGRRARDLMRLDASLDLPAALRLRVLEGYWDVLPRPPLDLASFAGRVTALSTRKRGPSGKAR